LVVKEGRTGVCREMLNLAKKASAPPYSVYELTP
jgi:hypothetical protein